MNVRIIVLFVINGASSILKNAQRIIEIIIHCKIIEKIVYRWLLFHRVSASRWRI